MEKNMRLYVVLVAMGTLLISGCDSPPTKSPASRSQMQSAETRSVSEALPGIIFNVAPDTLRDCDPARIAKVSWNATAAGVSSVRIFVLKEDGEEKLFTFQGAEGSADTGPWVTAKTVFVLKDGEETKQLAKFVVGSESCN
jgi:hypothetical protein